MDKKELQRRFESPFDARAWNEVLVSVFGVRKLHTHPKPISLASNSISRSAVELGFLTTSDDRIIGLYTIDILKGVRLERSKVQLRELIRNIYKYDVDGAIVIFNQEDNWRLSFISEIRVINEDGSVENKTTEPKRFTYLLGRGTKAKTPADRLSILSGRRLSLDDLRAAFSVEALNKEFYQKVAEQFYELVGATTGKGKKLISREAILALPGVSRDTPENKRSRQEFAVRLIGRIIFCWFLKVKRSDQQIPLLPDSLLSSESARKTKNYYHGVLEPLFFQVLNRPVEDRISDLPDAADSIPFLNGGLFEAQTEDFYNTESVTGNFTNYALKIPDDWFIALFEKLEQYNFTIDENSPTEIEVSVDPEMLGRIFENLLAEIDPDSGESARKSSGSFYTPREIVNYMVDESLNHYLKETLSGGDGGDADADFERSLRRLFSYRDPQNPFKPKQTRQLIDAIDQCKILDPACGSGAFPMGALQRLVHLLGKLDPENQYWKERQLEKLDKLIESAGAIDDPKVRNKVVSDLNKRRKDVNSDFAKKELDYGRKLFLIENCVHGVDIQPIAAEISKLRCFLTLIVDDLVNDKAPNRGVNPLPNLEFKFVTADALLRLPVGGLFQATTDRQLGELESVRHEYINSYGAGKEAAKAHFQKIQDEIFDEQTRNNRENPDKRALALSCWKPFSHERVNWFDPLWMFGVKEFHIVIGNPPYVQMQKDGGRLARMYAQENYETFERTGDVYCLFYEKGIKSLVKDGTLCYITSNKFMRANYGKSLRKFLWNRNISEIVDFGELPVFTAAATFPVVINVQNKPNEKSVRFTQIKTLNFESLSDVIKRESFELNADAFEGENWSLASSDVIELIEQIKANKTPLRDYLNFDIRRGIITGFNQAFVIDEETKDDLVRKDKSSAEIIVPFAVGDDIRKYEVRNKKRFLILTKIGVEIEKYPAILNHLSKYQKQLEKRWDKGNHWWELRACAYYDEFEKPKIVYPDIAKESRMTFVKSPLYVGNTVYMIPTDDKYLVAILNSALIFFFFSKVAAVLGDAEKGGRLRFFTQDVNRIPIPKISNEKQEPFENLVDYILFLKELDKEEQVNEYVPNGHLVEQFDEVIDALVFELYFEDEFRNADIAFHKYAARDFNSIDELDTKGKAKAIEAAYQKIRAKDSEIRNNLKLMDIRLADLIGPIKNAR